MSTPPDYYELLQVSPIAEQEVIQAAYKRLVDKWHTNRQPGDRSAFERLALLDEAFAVLSDPSRRKEYDSHRNQLRVDGVETEAHPRVAAAVPASPPVSPAAVGSPENSAATGRVAVGPAAWMLFTVGAIVFGLAHGSNLAVRPGAFLATCLIWGFMFGALAFGCFLNRWRTGITVVASLALIAAVLDLVVLGNVFRPPLRADAEPKPARQPSGVDFFDVTTGQQPAAALTPMAGSLETRFADRLIDPVGTTILANARDGKSWKHAAEELRAFGVADPAKYESQYRTVAARAKYARAEESLLGYFARRTIPFLSAGFQIGITQQYKSAQDRLSAGKATDTDYDTIARYEQLQEFDRNREREERPAIEP